MPDIIKKTVHVHFTDAQRAALADQMADVQSQIEGIEKEKDAARVKFNAALKVLAARMKEYADAVRAGEGDIVIDCMWKPDAAQPLEHLWRIDIMEIVETRQLSRTAAEKADAEKARQLDLVTPTAAPGPDGLAVAGVQPGTPVMDKVRKLRTGPTPPCPAPVADAPGGICGNDGDPDFKGGFCAHHHAALTEVERAAIHDAIQDSRRLARLQASAERRAAATREMDEAEEDSAWAGLHAQADRAEGGELAAIGDKLGCARAYGDRGVEPDGDYRARVKAAIDQAHKGAAARAALRPAPAPEVTGDGAVPPIVRGKPRELTPDLIAQLAQAARAGGPMAADEPPAPGNEAPPDEAPDDDAAPGNEAEPPPPEDDEIDGPQPD